MVSFGVKFTQTKLKKENGHPLCVKLTRL